MQENLLNILLLFPAGILLPGVTGRKLKWWMGLLVGITVSSAIEISQLWLCRGLFEFDDIIHNGIGCMMGAVLGSWCWLRMLKKFKMPGSFTLPEHFLNSSFLPQFQNILKWKS